MKRNGPLAALLLVLLALAARAEESEPPSAPAPVAPRPADAEEAALLALRSQLAAYRQAGDEARAARVLDKLAAALRRLRRDDEALARYQEAADAWRAQGKPVSVGRTLHAKGNFELDLRRSAQAEETFVAGLAVLAGSNQPWPEAALQLGLSSARRQRGDAAGALEAARRALELHEGRKDVRRAAKARGCVGVCLFCLGRYAEALDAHAQALEVLREHGMPDEIAGALTHLGNVHLRIGSFVEARSRYEEALDIHVAQGDRTDIGGTLANLGIVHEAAGELERARDRYEEALTIFEDGTDPQRLAAALAPAGIVDMRLGRYDAALAKELRAFELYESLEHKVGMTRALVNAAGVLERQGRLPEAHEACDRAEAILGTDAPPAARAAVMWSRSRVFLAARQPEAAVREARRAIDLIEALSRGLADTEEAGARDVYDGLFDVCLEAAVALGDAGVLAWVLEQSRAVVLRAGLAARCAPTASDDGDSPCLDLAEAQAVQRDAAERARAAEANGNLDEMRASEAELAEAEAELQRLMRREQRRSKAAASVLDTEPDDLRRLQSQLGASEALVLYGLAQDVAVALVVGSGADDVRTIPLGPVQPILDAMDAVRACEPEATGAEVAAATRRLRALLADPLALPGDTRRVLVSPAGVLGFVPFCLLLPGRDVVYVPSGTTYGQLRSGERKRGRGILALGNPVYDGRDADPDDESRAGAYGELPGLPATRPEVERIGTVQLLGEDASKSGLVASLAHQDRWLAVHFACHGLVDRERPMLSSLALSADDTHDGMLTCHEILQLDVPADLVVLAACETASGRVYRTEGIVGLTRAFLFAGADRVLCSLWAAPDSATEALMTRFYELWNPDAGEALGAAAALRRAQESVRDDPDHPEWKHPFYWGGWVLWGLPD